MTPASPDQNFADAMKTGARLRERLLGELGPEGYWAGELSSSALSTAVATIALGQMDARCYSDQIQKGLDWLATNANGDGGWGDTIRSQSNLSTTALCWAAFGAARADARYRDTVHLAERWITTAAGSLARLPEAIPALYGKDRTFSVPILVTLALSGRLGADGWGKVPNLPFELAMIPRRFYSAVSLPVVSYALPALIALGQAIHHHAPTRHAPLRWLRNLSRARTLDLLSRLQPGNGGFLEATPLTAFVTMSLASAGHASHPVAEKAAGFLRASMRVDGSWPIDTNLATWITTLSIKALAHDPGALSAGQKAHLRHWLLTQQTKTVHPYTGAAAGAWAWTDLPGGVPDADDTAGALLALLALHTPQDPQTVTAAERGLSWLMGLQNRDGGMPTFCRGWGTLPFDRSTPDITAHALRALVAWKPHLPASFQRRVSGAVTRCLRFLQTHQREDGAFIPLWFGNEHATEHANPVYGTAQVLIALNDLEAQGQPVLATLRNTAAAYLASCQTTTGGWGGAAGTPESVEETAVALEALSGVNPHSLPVERGLERLIRLVECQPLPASPIGLYFARLWYYERLYPLIFATGALGSVVRARSK